jgi:hypothetical protein
MALARRLDRADPRPAAPLARALTDVLADIRGEREPDAVDGLRRRRDARRLAVAAAGGTVHNEGGAA